MRMMIATLVLLLAVPAAAQPRGKKEFVFRGRVESLDPKAKTLTINGENVDGWMPAMTMPYAVDKEDVFGRVKAGDQVTAKVYEGDYKLYDVQVAPSTRALKPQPPREALRAEKAEAPLPADVDPGTRARLPSPKRADMDEYGKKVFDELVGSHQASLRFHSPRIAKPLAEAHHYAKFETGLPRRLVETAVLVAARELDNTFEWTQWAEHGQEAGLEPGSGGPEVEPAIIDVIRYCRPLTGLAEKDATVINIGREMIGQHHVSSDTFANAVRLFGVRGTVDLVELMALYSITGTEIIAFDTQLMKGQVASLPARASVPDCARRKKPAPYPSPAGPLPGDVNPASRSRLPLPIGDYSPRVAKPLIEAREYVDGGTELGARVTELAVLVTARELDNRYEWTLWEAHGRSGHAAPEAGPAIVDIIRHCKPVNGLDEKDATVIRFGRELFGRNAVSSGTFAKALGLFGRRGIVDLVDLMAIHAANAWEQYAFDVRLGAGQTPTLPERGAYQKSRSITSCGR